MAHGKLSLWISAKTKTASSDYSSLLFVSHKVSGHLTIDFLKTHSKQWIKVWWVKLTSTRLWGYENVTETTLVKGGRKCHIAGERETREETCKVFPNFALSFYSKTFQHIIEKITWKPNPKWGNLNNSRKIKDC